MKVPQFLPWIGDDEYSAIGTCFEQNWITEGPQAQVFQNKLLELMGGKYGVFAPNGTLALYLALKAVDIGPGDEVIVPDFTFIASANAVEMVGATPVFCDVQPLNCQIDLMRAEECVTSRPGPSCRYICMVRCVTWILWPTLPVVTKCSLSRMPHKP